MMMYQVLVWCKARVSTTSEIIDVEESNVLQNLHTYKRSSEAEKHGEGEEKGGREGGSVGSGQVWGRSLSWRSGVSVVVNEHSTERVRRKSVV